MADNIITGNSTLKRDTLLSNLPRYIVTFFANSWNLFR